MPPWLIPVAQLKIGMHTNLVFSVLMDDKVQPCLTEDSEVVSDVVAVLMLRGDRF